MTPYDRATSISYFPLRVVVKSLINFLNKHFLALSKTHNLILTFPYIWGRPKLL